MKKTGEMIEKVEIQIIDGVPEIKVNEKKIPLKNIFNNSEIMFGINYDLDRFRIVCRRADYFIDKTTGFIKQTD